MSARTIAMTDALHRYLVEHTLREPELFRQLRTETAAMPRANMQISPEQGQFMGLLVEILGVRRAIEIGVFTGYSALCVASAMPPDGRLIACDVNRETTAVARRYWRMAGVAERIDLRIAPALETLTELVEGGTEDKAGGILIGGGAAAREAGGAAQNVGGPSAFDFVFIDADKTNYDAYYELALRLLRPGGVIAVDNALWSGRVADNGVTDAETAALRALNSKVRGDARVSMSLVPIGDGLLLARKR